MPEEGRRQSDSIPKSIEVSLDYMQRDITEIKQKLDSNYITRTEFDPVRNIVYGMVGLILVSVIGAIIALVIK